MKVHKRNKNIAFPLEYLLQSHAYECQAHAIRSAVNLTSYHRVTVGTHIFRGALSLFQSLNQIGHVE